MTDYIDRQAAIDAINRAVTKEVARWSIEELPSVEVEPTEEQVKKYILDHNLTHKVFEPVKSGRWMWNADVRCSRCGHKLQTTGLPSYCPNCGAKMENT